MTKKRILAILLSWGTGAISIGEKGCSNVNISTLVSFENTVVPYTGLRYCTSNTQMYPSPHRRFCREIGGVAIHSLPLTPKRCAANSKKENKSYTFQMVIFHSSSTSFKNHSRKIFEKCAAVNRKHKIFYSTFIK